MRAPRAFGVDAMLATTATLVAALLPAHQAPGPAPVAWGGPSGRVAVRGWRFRAGDDGNPAGTFAADRVSVPHVANPASTDLATAQVRFRGGVGWYRTTVRVSARARYALRFDSVAHRADVWVDGQPAGAHAGAYDAFEVRPLLTPGRHVVVVRADWTSPNRQSAEGWHRTWFNYGGIDREVTLRRLGASEVTGVTTATRLLGGARGAEVTVAARVHNLTAAARPIGAIARLGSGLPFALPAARVGPGATTTLRRVVRVPASALWSPRTPRLTELAVFVPGDRRSAYRARMGLRELRWDGGVLRINGRRTVLRGASLQEDAPGHGDALRPADMDRAVRALRAIGANATRAQHPLSDGLLERLDRAGILVWQQIGPIDSPGEWRAGASAALTAAATRRVRVEARQLERHPSVAGWSLAIEVAYGGRPGQGAWIAENARWLHEHDPTRPVGVDVWGPRIPPADADLVRELDWIGTTDYLGWYEATYASLDRVEQLARHRLEVFGRRFPDKLLVVSEVGAEGSELNRGPARGGREYQARLLAAHLRAYAREREVDGVLVWVLADFAVNPAFGGGSIAARDRSIRFVRGLNQKGLFDRAGRPKPAVAAVRDGFARLPAG